MPPGEVGTTMAAGWFGSLRRIGKKNSIKSSQYNSSPGAISSVVQASCLSLTSLEDVSFPEEVSACPRLIGDFARSNSRVSVSTTDTDRDCSNSHCDDLIRESSVAEEDEDETFGNTSSDATRQSAKPPSGAKSKSRKSRFWSTNASQPELHKLATVTNKPSPTHSTKSVGYAGRASYAKTLGRNNKRSTVWHHQSEWDLVKQPQLRDEIAEVTAEMESMDNGEESKNALKAKHLSMGRKKFNMDPKKGIEFLVEHGLLRHTPEEVALFLYRGEGLNKTAIGDYLGERHDFNEKVLKAFVELHDFTDLILVQALRQFLWSFRLPGEAQKIDRMMECFAQRYCQLNPNIFSSLDTCYILSFSVIMLNTSLHNPSVKDKPTLENFISMNREIDHGKDVPRDILASLYESIKAEPFKIPEDDGNDLMHTFFNPDREGWLCKQGGRYKSWKRRWFILNDNCLYYFEYTTDKEPRGIIPLENIQVREVHDRHKPNCFELYATGSEFIKACKTDSEGKVVEGKHQVYRMSAATAEEKDAWIACIKTSISHNPFYDMLAARKKNAQKGIKTKS